MMAAASKYLVGTCTCCGRPDMPLRYGGGPSGEHTYCTSTKHGCKEEGRRVSAEKVAAAGKKLRKTNAGAA